MVSNISCFRKAKKEKYQKLFTEYGNQEATVTLLRYQIRGSVGRAKVIKE